MACLWSFVFCGMLHVVLCMQTRQVHRRDVVFLAGLKGSVHEFWFEVFKACQQSGTCRSGTEELRKAIYQERDDVDALRKAWAADKMDGGSATLLLNGYNSTTWGMMSYPIEQFTNTWAIPARDLFGDGDHVATSEFSNNFSRNLTDVRSPSNELHELDRDLQNNPRLDNYLEVAKNNSDRLSVIILLDPEAAHTLQSFMSVGRPDEESLYLSADILEQQLRLVPPERRVCIDVTTLQALTEEAEQRLTKSNKRPYDFTPAKSLLIKREESFRCVGAKCASARMRDTMSRLRKLCGERTVSQMLQVDGDIDVNRNQAIDVVNLLFGKDYWGC